MRTFHVFLTCIIFLTTCFLITSQESMGQESTPKAVIQLDCGRVDVDFSLYDVNIATFTGSVVLDLNQSEEGIVELEGDAGEWPMVISPSEFYVQPNTTSVNFLVDVSVPPEVFGGLIHMVNVSGNLVTSEDNTTTHAIEPVQGIISVSTAYSVGIEFSNLYVEIPPASQTKLKAFIHNYGSEGIFKVNIQNSDEFSEMDWAVTVQPSVLHLAPGTTGVVNLSVNLPELWTIWTSWAYPITLNVTTENGTFLENSTTFINVEGYYIGGFEWVLCLLFIVPIILMVLGAAFGGTSTAKGKDKKLMKLEKKKMRIEIMQKKLERKGAIKEKDAATEEVTEPLSCPMCYSDDVKTLLSGRFKCRNCERLFEKEDTESDGRDDVQQEP